MSGALLFGTAGTAAIAPTVGIGATLGGGIGLVGGAAAIAPTAGLFGAAGIASTAGILKGALTLLGASSFLAGGLSDSAALEAQGRLFEVQAARERLAGTEEQNEIRRDLIRRLAANAARTGAAGIDLASGSPIAVTEALFEEANRQLDISRSNALLGESEAIIQSDQARLRSRSAVSRGVSGAAVSLVSLVPT